MVSRPAGEKKVRSYLQNNHSKKDRKCGSSGRDLPSKNKALSSNLPPKKERKDEDDIRNKSILQKVSNVYITQNIKICNLKTDRNERSNRQIHYYTWKFQTAFFQYLVEQTGRKSV
jgi:hypothetical protein